MEVKNSKIRQNLNTKAGKIVKISKGRNVRIVLKRCDAQKELKKGVSKLRAVKIILEQCDNLVKQCTHQRKRQVAKTEKRYYREVSIILQRCDTQRQVTQAASLSGHRIRGGQLR